MSGELIFESKIENDNKNTLIKNLALLISSSSKFKNSFIITIEPRFMLINYQLIFYLNNMILIIKTMKDYLNFIV